MQQESQIITKTKDEYDERLRKRSKFKTSYIIVFKLTKYILAR